MPRSSGVRVSEGHRTADVNALLNRSLITSKTTLANVEPEPGVLLSVETRLKISAPDDRVLMGMIASPDCVC